MAETREPFPPTVRGGIPHAYVEQLLAQGRPDRVDPASAKAVLEGDDLFEAILTTDPHDPRGAIYRIAMLDAAVIVPRGEILTQSELLVFGEIPSTVKAPKEPGSKTLVIIPWALISETIASMKK